MSCSTWNTRARRTRTRSGADKGVIGTRVAGPSDGRHPVRPLPGPRGRAPSDGRVAPGVPRGTQGPRFSRRSSACTWSSEVRSQPVSPAPRPADARVPRPGSAGGVSHPERTGRQIEGVEVRARRLAPDPSSEAVHAPSRRPQGVGAPCGPDVVTLPPVEPDSRVRSIGSDVGGGGRNDARSNQRGGPITMPSRATGVLRWGRSTRPTVAREPGRRRTGANVLGMTGARELRCTLACCSTWKTARAPCRQASC